MEDVPADVAENWIDQLTIRQFNEELKDIFPYSKLSIELISDLEIGHLSTNFQNKVEIDKQ